MPAGDFLFPGSKIWLLRRKCSSCGCFILFGHILAALAKDVPAQGFSFCIGTVPISNENVPSGAFLFSPGAFWVFCGKMYHLVFIFLSRYILAFRGENVPALGFLVSSITFSPFRPKKDELGVLYSQLIHFGHFGAKIYRLEVFNSQRAHFDHFRPKCTVRNCFLPPVHWDNFGRTYTGCGFLILSRYVLAILRENLPGGIVFFPAGIFFGISGDNVRSGGFSLSSGAFWQFRTNLY